MKEGQEKTGVFTLRSLLEKQNRTKTPAADCTPEQQQAVEKIVEEALGVRPEWNAPGGEIQP